MPAFEQSFSKESGQLVAAEGTGSDHVMGLPNTENAEIDLRKLSESCLSPEHPVGRHKAAVFRAALGLRSVDALVLRDLILKAEADNEAVFERTDEFGNRFRVDFEIANKFGRATIRSAWIMRPGRRFPAIDDLFCSPEMRERS